MTVKNQILQYMQTHEYLTIGEAFKNFGIIHLSPIIRDLQADGHYITRETITRDSGLSHTEWIAYRYHAHYTGTAPEGDADETTDEDI